jgi:hypothetical protein
MRFRQVGFDDTCNAALEVVEISQEIPLQAEPGMVEPIG